MQSHVLAGEPELALRSLPITTGAAGALSPRALSGHDELGARDRSYRRQLPHLRARLPWAWAVGARHRRLPARWLCRRRRPHAAADRRADDRRRALARRGGRDRARARFGHPLVSRRLPRGSTAVPRAARHVSDEQLRSHVPGDTRCLTRLQARRRAHRRVPRPPRGLAAPGRETGSATTSTTTRWSARAGAVSRVDPERDHLVIDGTTFGRYDADRADPLPGDAGARRSCLRARVPARARGSSPSPAHRRSR